MAGSGDAAPGAPELPSFLISPARQLLLFGGKGGVGKTTCAVAAALHRAARMPSSSLLLVSADPAHSLRDSLAEAAPPQNLEVLELDAPGCLAAFRAEHGDSLEKIAAAGTFLDDEDVRRFLNLSLPGLDELMAFLQISSWVDRRRYGCIIVDTAPSGHALRLLAIPSLMRTWLSALDALLAKPRYLRKVFGRSTAPDLLDRFVSEWWASVKRMTRLLRDPARCQFVPVTIAEELSVRETAMLLAELRRARIAVSDVLINQLHPGGPCPACRQTSARERDQIRRISSSAGPLRFWHIERLAEEVRGKELLGQFWDHASLLAAPLAPAIPPPLAPRLPARNPAALPSADTRLLLFAGKGGVGKTTLACATAVGLANAFPHRRILLFSTDPAHSLAACLQAPVGSRPVPITCGLTAVEIDAGAEFAALKARYADDIRAFFQSLSASFDLTFDRVVLEKILDLAPPGLDEVMALARIIDFLASGAYDQFVLDPAATGHFLRLMELPALADQWLKTMFDFLLKYEQVFTLPAFSDHLVRFSKNLKQFRRLLADPRRAVVYAVSIPAAMAWEETRDLLQACGRMGVRVPALFLNLLTPPGNCAWCAKARLRESVLAARFRDEFPRQRLIAVYRQEPPAGLKRLLEFGRTLFEPASEESAAVEVGR